MLQGVTTTIFLVLTSLGYLRWYSSIQAHRKEMHIYFSLVLKKTKKQKKPSLLMWVFFEHLFGSLLQQVNVQLSWFKYKWKKKWKKMWQVWLPGHFIHVVHCIQSIQQNPVAWHFTELWSPTRTVGAMSSVVRRAECSESRECMCYTIWVYIYNIWVYYMSHSTDSYCLFYSKLHFRRELLFHRQLEVVLLVGQGTAWHWTR